MMELRGAGILIEDLDGKVLVLHRQKNVRWGNMWGIPGGHIRPELTPYRSSY